MPFTPAPDQEQNDGSFSLIERVILSAGAMLMGAPLRGRLAEAASSLTLASHLALYSGCVDSALSQTTPWQLPS